jgi:putative aminopeptidase FrvX
VLRKKDATADFDADFTVEIQEHCQALEIPYSYNDSWIEAQNASRTKPMSLGRTELGRLVAATGGQINGTTLQIPITGYHTASETASLSSVRAAIELLGRFVG